MMNFVFKMMNFVFKMTTLQASILQEDLNSTLELIGGALSY